MGKIADGRFHPRTVVDTKPFLLQVRQVQLYRRFRQLRRLKLSIVARALSNPSYQVTHRAKIRFHRSLGFPGYELLVLT